MALAFAKLRDLAQAGAVSYPYSMREAVAVARHLEAFPEDSVAAALTNVLAFEAFDVPLRRQLAEVFESQGFDLIGTYFDKVFGPFAGDAGSELLSGRTAAQGHRIDIKYLLHGTSASSIPKTDANMPKHGEVDPTGNPHVGGNRWAGGSGGSDTAGLGGRGGPYRLSDGNPVHQVSDDAKAAVSDQARATAREMAQQAWRQRLAEIESMDAKSWAMYNGILGRVAPLISQLQGILRQALDKKRERTWLRNQSEGELDDTRLIEGAAGEQLVFKRRGFEDNPHRTADNDPERRRRRICFVMDCSGSMYRFNLHDQRLERMLEVTCLILESMEGFQDRFEYALVGHSGETSKVVFADYGSPPPNRGERLKILQQMVAHTQFCMPGDNTIEATRQAVSDIMMEADGSFRLPATHNDHGSDENNDRIGHSFVVVLSDANFSRYRMDPAWWSDALTKDPQVEGHAVMVGSLGNEAHRICESLPPGRGHVVVDTAMLPATFRSIFERAGILADEF